MGLFLNKFSKRLEMTDKRQYYRAQFQTFMTAPEWRNVEMAEEYAAFLQENRSLFKFPYFRQISGLWTIIFKSWRAASHYDTQKDILLADYTAMDLFVGVFTTLELLPKAFLSLMLSPFVSATNPTDYQREMGHYYQQYAQDLQTIPFYDHDYKSYYQQLKQTYRNSSNRTWGDWFSSSIVSLELIARRLISKPLHYWFHQEANLVSASTDILVKARLEGTMDNDNAKNQFCDLLQQTSHDDIQFAKEDIFVKEGTKHKNGQSYRSVYARLQAPRYKDFIPAVEALSAQNIAVKKIAGQDQVQIKCVANHSAGLPPHATNTSRSLYSYGDDIHPGKRFYMFDIPVRDLQENVAQLNRQDGVDVAFIHNF